MKSTYPTIHKAMLEILYDNGMVNRLNPEEVVVAAAWDALNCQLTEQQLLDAEHELSILSTAMLCELATGEEGHVIVSNLSERVLDAIFQSTY